MNKFKLSLFFRYAINLVYALLFVFPICQIYDPYASEVWTNRFVYSEGYLHIFAPFGILWILFQIVKNEKFKTFAKWSCLIVTALYFIGTLGTILVPIQDYVPQLGSHLLLLLFPLLASMIFSKKREEDIIEDYEDILDA